jgi:MATE family multidrug resistance protein
MQKDLIKTELKASIQLASPLIAALLAQMAMEMVNSVMLGKLSAHALAAGGLSMAIFFSLIVLCNGIFSATGVIIARDYGAKNHSEISRTLSQSIYLAILLSIPCFFFLRLAPYFLIAIGQDPKIIELVTIFLHSISWGIPPLIVYFALREFISALSLPRVIMFLSLILAPLTAALNYILMYGKWGLKPLGIAGVGYSNAVMEWLLLGATLFFILKSNKMKPYFHFNFKQPIHWPKIKEIITLGIPVSATMGLEVGLFSITTIQMGYFGADALAAHQIALQCATVAFMFPLGFAQATAIRVGQSIGNGSVQKAKYAGYMGLLLGTGIALVTAIIFTSMPTFIISLFIEVNDYNQHTLIPLGVSFISVMALFQLVDATQVIMNGALRGLKDTFVPMWLGLLSYWVSGLLSGYLLAFYFKLGGIGLWWGLGIGIGVSALLLLLRFNYKIQ